MSNSGFYFSSYFSGMKEVHHISGSGNNSGLKIYESEDNSFIIKIPKVLVTKSWRYLIIGIFFLLLSILVPVLFYLYGDHFYLKLFAFGVSSGFLLFGGGLSAIATWEIRSTIDLTLSEKQFTIHHPAFFKYRSLTRTFPNDEIHRLYVNKVKVIGKEKYSLMIDIDPLDERLVKGFYVPEQALWIASRINDHLKVL